VCGNEIRVLSIVNICILIRKIVKFGSLYSQVFDCLLKNVTSGGSSSSFWETVWLGVVPLIPVLQSVS
jgi:hypothetical protein